MRDRVNTDPKMADPVYFAEFERARARVLRRRMVWCLAILLGLVAFGSIGTVIGLLEYLRGEPTPLQVVVLSALYDINLAAAMVAALLYVLNGKPDRGRLVRAITISTIVMMAMATFFEIKQAGINQTDFMDEPLPPPVDTGLWACRWGLAVLTLMVALPLIVIPMRWTESIRIAASCWVVYVVLVVLVGGASARHVLSYGVVALAVPIPAILFSQWRYLRFDAMFQHAELKGRFGELSAELGHARQLHEALFPRPLETGPVRVGFVYEPMREIGGDYLFVHAPEGGAAGGAVYVVLIDVAGHGVAAALAVNRLHGELVRMFASAGAGGAGARAMSAGDVIAGLNSYVHLTLAPQAVFATAVCLKIEAVGTAEREAAVEWCNAGHPPALLWSGAGKSHWLEPTATMLGVLEPEIYSAHVHRVPIVPGDVVVAYTDGLPETRDGEGREFGIGRIEEVVKSGEGAAAALVNAAAKHRGAGRVMDDTLVVEVSVVGCEARDDLSEELRVNGAA